VDPAAVLVNLADEELGVAHDWTVQSVPAGADYAAAVAVQARHLVLSVQAIADLLPAAE
jgi:hypothetical protein